MGTQRNNLCERENVDSTQLAQSNVQSRAVLNTVRNHEVPQNPRIS
jgi:hypothetical protein